jgi:hypothetical protein
VSEVGLTDTVGTVTVKGVAEAAVPPEVATVMVPLVAPPGTVAVSVVLLVTATLVADTPLKATVVLAVKKLPVIATLVPTGPEAGVKPLIVGALVAVAAPVIFTSSMLKVPLEASALKP